MQKKPAPKRKDELIEYLKQKFESLKQRDTSYFTNLMLSLMERYDVFGLYDGIRQQIERNAGDSRRTAYKVIDDIFAQPTADKWLQAFYRDGK